MQNKSFNLKHSYSLHIVHSTYIDPIDLINPIGKQWAKAIQNCEHDDKLLQCPPKSSENPSEAPIVLRIYLFSCEIQKI